VCLLPQFVFDQSFAHAFRRQGQRYYPKLQNCVPFTPCTGPRFLVKPGESESNVKRALASAMEQYVGDRDMSSAHVTFPLEAEVEEVQASQGTWVTRLGVQYHWVNKSYQSFNDFEQALRQKKRKSIRQERKRPAKEGLTIKRLIGDDITSRDMKTSTPSTLTPLCESSACHT
jgi:predicted N-acyltransferase